MKIKIACLALIACALALDASAQNVQGDPARGRTKAYTCTGCHGIPSYVNAYPTFHVPKLGGQNFEYLVAALKAYRAGEREHPTMRAQASSLTDQDIADVASYFVSLAPDAAEGGAEIASADASGTNSNLQLCSSCHGMDGIGLTPIYPKLAGQYADYMLHALRGYKSGQRQNAVMAGIVTTLSEQDMKELAAYYAAKPGLVDLSIK